MILLKTLLLLSAAAVAILRFILFRYDSALDENTARILSLISFAAAAVCVITAGIWVLRIKREEKENKEHEKENG